MNQSVSKKTYTRNWLDDLRVDVDLFVVSTQKRAQMKLHLNHLETGINNAGDSINADTCLSHSGGQNDFSEATRGWSENLFLFRIRQIGISTQ